MKHVLIIMIIAAFCVTNAFALDFSPALLKLSAAPLIQYDFDGSDLKIPTQVSGTPAFLWFFVYTKDQAENIGPVQNGHLGWHYVNKIDTCIYMSSSSSFSKGNNLVIWDGKDNDGNAVPAGDYTYYMWAYDGISLKTRMTMFFHGYYHTVDFQEVDEQGNPLANPIFYSKSQRWRVGSDPMDSTLIETCDVVLPEGWGKGDNSWIDQRDFDYIFQGVKNEDSRVMGVTRWEWVPNGEAVQVTDFGEDGYLLWGSQVDSHSPEIVSDNNYIYTVDQGYHFNDGVSNFYVVSFEGEIIAELDMLEWWSDPDDLEAGGQMVGGPDSHYIRKSTVFLNCHCSCLKQMVDPLAWLESGDSDDFYLWSSGNGDYVLDKNWEPDSERPWVCNDFKNSPHMYTSTMDANYFSITTAKNVGALSFGLLAPDGTGVGYMPYAGDTQGRKMGNFIVDSGTPFDGLYADNNSSIGTDDNTIWDLPETRGTWFVGHDSIKGVITNQVAVEETQSAFTVAQNSPNPFNPSTTISFSIPETGNVTIDVFNVAGQKVDTVASEFMEAGSHSVTWEASGFSAGVYFYTVKSGDFSRTMKMTLLK